MQASVDTMSVREVFSLVKSSIRFLGVGLLFLAVVLFVCLFFDCFGNCSENLLNFLTNVVK